MYISKLCLDWKTKPTNDRDRLEAVWAKGDKEEGWHQRGTEQTQQVQRFKFNPDTNSKSTSLLHFDKFDF